MNTGSERYVFVLQHRHESFDELPFSIARTWREDKGLDVAMYLMYDTVELMKKDVISNNPDIAQTVDTLLAEGVPVYVCGFCSRACGLTADDYHPGVQVGNRHLFHAMMTERQPVYW